MAHATDFRCDLTGEAIRLSAVPVVVRLQVAVVPGALVDPAPEALPPFLRAMLFAPDGTPRAGVLELGADAFTRHVTVDLAALTPALAGPPPDADEAAQLRATITALEVTRQRLEAEKHDLTHAKAIAEAEREVLRGELARRGAAPTDRA